MSAQPVDIQIFGRLFRVNCPQAQQQALQNAAHELDNRLHELKKRTNVSNTEQLIFIAALNLCYELTQEKDKNEEYTMGMEQRIQSLQQAIEQVLIEQQNSYHASEQTIL